jgi:hypothetical protein
MGTVVWVVTWDGYVHGVFESEDEAEEFCSRRWNGYASRVRVEEWTVGTGWNPAAEARTPVEDVV